MNFNNVIKKNKEDEVAIVQFYVPYDGGCKKLAPEWAKLATQLKGLVQACVVDCSTEADLCKEYNVDKYPAIKLFPAGPFKIPRDYTGDLNMEKIGNWAKKALVGFVTAVKADNIDEFLLNNKSKPHAFIFTDKPKSSSVTKGLSKDFKGRILVGEVLTTDEGNKGIMTRYKVKKAPALVLVVGDKETLTYKGEYQYEPMFKFLNNYAETWAMESATAPQEAEPAQKKPWLNEQVPQVTSESFAEICLEKSGLCMIIVADPERPDGKPAKLSSATLAVLSELQAKHEQHINRGTPINYMWVDAGIEQAFVSGFQVAKAPAVIVMKPGKRKRYYTHAGDVTVASVSGLVERAIGGDLRFTGLETVPKLNPPAKR